MVSDGLKVECSIGEKEIFKLRSGTELFQLVPEVQVTRQAGDSEASYLLIIFL